MWNVAWTHTCTHVCSFLFAQCLEIHSPRCWFIYFDSILWAVGENMSVCKSASNTFEGKDERWITRPTHCRNVRPEGSSPAVLLEVNSTGTHREKRPSSLELDTKSLFQCSNSDTWMLKCVFKKSVFFPHLEASLFPEYPLVLNVISPSGGWDVWQVNTRADYSLIDEHLSVFILWTYENAETQWKRCRKHSRQGAAT